MAAGGLVCRSKVLLLIDFNRVISLSYFIGASPCNQGRWTHRIHGSCRRLHTSRGRATPTTPTTPSTPDLSAVGCTATTTTPGVVSSRGLSDLSCPPEASDVTVSYFRGLPQVTVPLPSRNERCRFTLRPISNTVGDFLEMLRHEDHGIDRATINSLDGVRIASSNTIEALMEEDFKLIVNDTVYLVNTPKQEKLSQEELRQLSDVRNLVNQLYEALNVEEHQLQKEREILRELEALNMELQPLEEKCTELEEAATRRTTLLTWAGLGLMSVQFGILARLTWWEYSWDIMEPVTYFVTYGTAMAGYAYFVLTKQEYMLPDVKDRQHLITVHKKARKAGVDLQHYNQLKDEIARLTRDLHRLRDPLQIHLPPHHLQTQPKSTLKTIMEFIRSRKAAAKDA